MEKLKLIISLLIFSSLAVWASDLVIESKSQTYSESDNRIKFNGDINNITINKAISPKGFEQEINITSEVKKVYNK